MSRSGFVVVGCVLLLACGGLVWLTGELGVHGSPWFYVVAAVCAVGGAASFVVAWLRPSGWVCTTPYADTPSFDLFAISFARWLLSLAVPVAEAVLVVYRAVAKSIRLARDRGEQGRE